MLPEDTTQLICQSSDMFVLFRTIVFEGRLLALIASAGDNCVNDLYFNSTYLWATGLIAY